MIQVLEVTRFHADDLDFLSRAEAVFDHLSVSEVLRLDLVEGAEVARCAVFPLYNYVELAVVL